MANKAALDPYGLYLARLERKAKQKGWNIANFFRQRLEFFFFKSVNLQYNTLGRWDDCLIDQVSDVPSITFFHNFLQKRVLSALSPSQKPTVLFSIYQNNTWTIGHLVNETINQVNQILF